MPRISGQRPGKGPTVDPLLADGPPVEGRAACMPQHVQNLCCTPPETRQTCNLGSEPAGAASALSIWQGFFLRGTETDITRACLCAEHLLSFWESLPFGRRKELLSVPRKALFERVRRELPCPRCFGLLRYEDLRSNASTDCPACREYYAGELRGGVMCTGVVDVVLCVCWGAI